MITRSIQGRLEEYARQFRAVSITGPRQAGKSTLAMKTFPDYEYISFEEPDVRATALDDPRGFLDEHPRHAIFDEVQRVPELFSYLQGAIDRENEPGQYILSGSQNFLLTKGISQSLAGRVGVLNLLPCSYSELKESGVKLENINEYIFRGGYPYLHGVADNPTTYFDSYVATYIERDVRAELGVRKISAFRRFLIQCATRIGSTLNIAQLANDAGIDSRTASDWLSVLEASYLVYMLEPYSKNFGKRSVKSPKLYFTDTGLACQLLNIKSVEQLESSEMRGHLYENAVIMDFIKVAHAAGKDADLSFWRDERQNEIDLIVERGGAIDGIVEVKSSSTYRPSAFATMERLAPMFGVGEDHRYLLYAGDESFDTRHGHVLGFDSIPQLVGV